VIIPGNRDVPPVTTILFISAGRISGSQAAREVRIMSGKLRAGGRFIAGSSGAKSVVAGLKRGTMCAVLDPSGNSNILLGRM